MMKFARIAIVAKYQDDQLASQIVMLANHLAKLDCQVYIACGEHCQIGVFAKLDQVGIKHPIILGSIEDWFENIDVIVVLGGDGTLLGVARKVVNYNIPIIGINQGRLGFMTDIASSEMLDYIDAILLSSEYLLETRSLISAEIVRNEQIIFKNIALNDIVISRGAIGSMIEFEISIDKQFVLSQKSDGIIFTTPTGSTAYSLAAGGPIMHPNAHTFAIVPICPQSLSNRPIVVPDNVEIEFNLIKDNPTQIHYDGQECFDLRCNDKIILRKYSDTILLLHPLNYNYYHTLRNKLDWSKRVS